MAAGARQTVGMLTVFGAAAVTFMMLMYALERRRRVFILAFACGCALSSAYGFLAGTWAFGVVEAIWAAIALHRYHASVRQPGSNKVRHDGVAPHGRQPTDSAAMPREVSRASHATASEPPAVASEKGDRSR